jgi:hypothetical protein
VIGVGDDGIICKNNYLVLVALPVLDLANDIVNLVTYRVSQFYPATQVQSISSFFLSIYISNNSTINTR